MTLKEGTEFHPLAKCCHDTNWGGGGHYFCRYPHLVFLGWNSLLSRLPFSAQPLLHFPVSQLEWSKFLESNKFSLGFPSLTSTHQKSRTSLLSRAPESGTNNAIPLALLLLFPSRHSLSVLKGQKMFWDFLPMPIHQE